MTERCYINLWMMLYGRKKNFVIFDHRSETICTAQPQWWIQSFRMGGAQRTPTFKTKGLETKHGFQITRMLLGYSAILYQQPAHNLQQQPIGSAAARV